MEILLLNSYQLVGKKKNLKWDKNFIVLLTILNSLTFIEHPRTAEYTLFSHGHRMFTTSNHMLRHETNVKTLQNNTIIQICSEQSKIKLKSVNNIAKIQ